MRDVIRVVQNTRKQAGLQVDDRITLCLSTNDTQLKKAINEHLKTIKVETLTRAVTDKAQKFETVASIDGAELRVSLQKA